MPRHTNIATPSMVTEKLRSGEISEHDRERFLVFLARKKREVDQHEVITHNPYTKWFKRGAAHTRHIQDLVLQFSVFSNHFLPIQCKRMVNVATEAGERGARAILASEIGVGLDVETGDTEGNAFHHKNAHINWIREMAGMLDLDQRNFGRWSSGSETTHVFLEQLEETYGSRNGNIGSGASFAIETWAGFGIGKGKKAEHNNFWRELVLGLEAYNRTHRLPNGLLPLDIGFFQYHFALESGHVANVEAELMEVFFEPEFDEEKWFEGARKALDAIHTFWKGLDETRRRLEAQKD